MHPQVPFSVKQLHCVEKCLGHILYALITIMHFGVLLSVAPLEGASWKGQAASHIPYVCAYFEACFAVVHFRQALPSASLQGWAVWRPAHVRWLRA